MVSLALTLTAAANAHDAVTLQFSDGRGSVQGVEPANAVLQQVHVRVSLVPIPKEAERVLASADERSLKPSEKEKLLKVFELSRSQLLEQIRLAGRQPATPEGGSLQIRAENGGTYPNVSDLSTVTGAKRTAMHELLGPLHVNSAADGTGIDEVMTAVRGGPFTWFFVLPDGVVARLTSLPIKSGDPGVRVSYSGLTPHAGFMPERGVAIGNGHGPKTFVIRHSAQIPKFAEMLGSNPWIDFSGEPRMMPAASGAAPAKDAVAMANPASTYCASIKGRSVIAKLQDGSSIGLCYLPDGKVIEEWTLFRMNEEKQAIGGSALSH